MRFPSVAYPCASALWIVEVKAVLVGAGMAPQIGTVNDLRPLNYSGNLRHNALLPSFWYTPWKMFNDLFSLQPFFFTTNAVHLITTVHQHIDLVTNFIPNAVNDVRYNPNIASPDYLIRSGSYHDVTGNRNFPSLRPFGKYIVRYIIRLVSTCEQENSRCVAGMVVYTVYFHLHCIRST